MKVESPERIWIESDGLCPYFYPEDELSDVSPPITEYVRADKLEELAAEIEALRAEVEVWKASFEQAASGHAVYSERTEQLEALVRELVAVCSESGMYDEEVFAKARAALAKENSND